VASVLVLGEYGVGLRAAAAARGLTLVRAGEPEARACRHAVNLPGHDRFRTTGCPTLHVVRGESAVVRALDAGVDDAVDAAASDTLIAARLAALVRRTSDGGTIRIGDLVIDRVERRVSRAGRDLALLPREYALLLELAAHPGAVVSRTALHVAVCNLRFDPGTNVLAVHVSRLRAKLDRGFAVPMLRTEKGVGYRLVAADETRG
jgi:two-component system OmpR family response regulator